MSRGFRKFIRGLDLFSNSTSEAIAWMKGEAPGPLERLQHSFEGKGHYGEFLTEYALKNGDLGNVAVFSNVLVPRSYGAVSTSEIDAIMLHEKGIFVIESKNYSGWIFGSAEQKDWTVTYSAKTKGRFYNPIMQNRSHVKALSEYMELEPWYFKSYIVFTDKCTFKSVPLSTSEYTICKKNQLLSNLRSDLDGRRQVFHPAKFAQIRGILAKLEVASTEEERLQHTRETMKVAYGVVCPVCGSQLVKRTGKYGEFLGCSRYPDCTFTRNI